MTFGLTPAGFNKMRLADIKTALENAFIAQFGDINVDPQSVFGQEIGVLSKDFADLWENLEDIYFSQYPNSASGVSLDNVVALNGITRLPETQTNVIATLSGFEGTIIPRNSQASIPSTNDTFYNPNQGLISQTNANAVTIKVDALATQQYIVLLSNQVFVSSLPVITFTHSPPVFDASNVITVFINGVAIPAVNYTTDSDTTLAAIASEIELFIAGTTAVPTNPDTITITPPLGSNVTITNIQITGGSYQSGWGLTYLAPANNNALTAALTALINANSPPWTCYDGMDGTITVLANAPTTSFSAQAGTNLSIIARASPVLFLCEQFGPVALPQGALTNIVTPIAGWETITNLIAGATGTLTETDAQLRIRRQNSIKLLASATVESIRAGLLQKVPGVTSALVFENRTLTQLPISIVFPAPFTSGDVIAVTCAGITPFTVNFNTDQATTMNDLVSAFELIPAVANATHGGSGDQTLTVNMNILQDLIVETVTTNVSAQTAIISGGRPPKSFECVVEGGTNLAIANQIWLTKPAGIETYGTVEQDITDSQGNTQAIFFSRPTPIYIWVNVVLTLYSPETFPINGIALVQQSINKYGNSLGIGVSVLWQRVLAQIFNVPGIASGVLTMTETAAPTDSPPSYSASDITISETQVSIFDLTRIVVTI
ncbi:MAG: hypothetical protein C5B43_01330 [Verrucomicrobia bacterium]|nr:MAG: hypothetical protein C5B43_01330 [Verrucomicrobiota bacterium]